jgi:hypothetical protein
VLVTNREADEDTALAIELTIMAKEFHTLPHTGGLLDQDYRTIQLLRAGLHGLSKKAEREKNQAEAKAHRGR